MINLSREQAQAKFSGCATQLLMVLTSAVLLVVPALLRHQPDGRGVLEAVALRDVLCEIGEAHGSLLERLVLDAHSAVVLRLAQHEGAFQLRQSLPSSSRRPEAAASGLLLLRLRGANVDELHGDTLAYLHRSPACPLAPARLLLLIHHGVGAQQMTARQLAQLQLCVQLPLLSVLPHVGRHTLRGF